jgi:hypothetical protein
MLAFSRSIATDGRFFAPIGDARISAVDTRDIADVAAAALTEQRHAGQTYTITGPAAITHGAIAAALSRATGREVDSEFEADEVDYEEVVARAHRGRHRCEVKGVATKPIRVDGVERPFAFASGEGRWVAVGRVGDVTVTVDAFGFDPNEVHLRALADPTQVIGGKPEYRPQRGAFDVLDSRRIAALAESTPVSAVGQQLAAAAKPAIALVATESPGACAVLYSPGGGELRSHRFPPSLHGDSRLPEQPVRPSVGLTVPDPSTVMDKLGIDLAPGFAEELFALRDRLDAEQGWHQIAGQLLGWPHWQNDDGMDYLAELGGGQARDWSLLLQTDRLDAELYVALATEDLTAGRFDRAQATIEFD